MKVLYKIDYPKKITGMGISKWNEYLATSEPKNGDVFDINIGKEVVKLKLNLKQLRTVEKVNDERLAEANRELEMIMNSINKLMENQNKIQKQKEKVLEQLKKF